MLVCCRALAVALWLCQPAIDRAQGGEAIGKGGSEGWKHGHRGSKGHRAGRDGLRSTFAMRFSDRELTASPLAVRQRARKALGLV